MLSGVVASLSARRAWIEMAVACCAPLWMPVALRKESVDRNRCSYLHSNMSLESLSARRAWIEIDCGVFADVVAERG